ncbi:hypothetical protein SRABI106_04773 [Rahnella aquatilis]|nr:hypothetical protein SRABI106_04773 [Rahnella aquatilis]
MVFINTGDFYRIEVFADLPFRRRGLFTLQNKSRSCPLQGMVETALALSYVVLKAGQRLLIFTCRDPNFFIANNFVEHGFLLHHLSSCCQCHHALVGFTAAHDVQSLLCILL